MHKAHGRSTRELGAPGLSARWRRARARPRCPGPRRPPARLTLDPGGMRNDTRDDGARGTAPDKPGNAQATRIRAGRIVRCECAWSMGRACDKRLASFGQN
eukprot:9883940-Alexandrium_andersonii.AAC.1